MPEILDDVTYLSRDIGPRPAGTEEEQQAALYITEQFQKGAGLSATIEDFKCAGNSEIVPVICFGVTFIATILSLFIAAFALPAVVLTVVVAVLYALELFDKPVLSRILMRGVSQNVVAKYEPGSSEEEKSIRRRKIVVLAHYDSGKASPELIDPVIAALPLINRATPLALFVIPLILIVRYFFFLYAVGSTAILFNVITVVALIIVALPLVVALLHKIAAYNEAANCNASGVAVMLEVARRVGNGRISAAELAYREEAAAQIHGEEQARAAGLIPEGAQLVYAASQVKAPEPPPQTEADRLAAAKAAIAALTGQSVRDQPTDIYNHLVQTKEQPLAAPTQEAWHDQIGATREVFTGANFAGAPKGAVSENQEEEASAAPLEEAAPSQPVAAPPQTFSPTPRAADGVPEWYKKAKASVKKDKAAPKVQRSHYADALNAISAESPSRVEPEPRTVDGDTEERLRALQNGIREAAPAPSTSVPAPIEEARPVSAPIFSPEPGRDLSPETTTAMEPIDSDALRRQATPAPEPEVAPAPVFAPAPAPAPEPEVAPAPTSTPEPTPEPVRMPAVKQQVAAWQAARSARSDSTTAMQPIDVEALRQQASAASEPECAPAPESTPASMPQSELQPEPAPRTRARRSIRFGDEIADLVSAPLPQPRIPLMDEPSSSGFEHVPAPEKRFDEPVDAATQFIDSQLMAEQQVAASPKSARKLPIVLPDVSPTAAPLPSIAEVSKQRAPLAEAETCGKTAAKSLLSTMIPEVSLEAEPASLPDAPRSVKINPVDIPSLSGVLKAQAMQENAVESEPAAVSATGSFVPIGATGSFAPVGDALLADVAFEDRYIDDADDSAYAGNVTETGAFAGPGYVDMPKSRARKFLDKFAFRKKSKDEESTPQEWLEVDDDFDARSAGAARGGWDSFQAKDTFEDTQDAVADTGAEIFPEIDDDGFAPLPVNSPAARNNRFGGVRAPSFEGVGSDFDAAEPFEDDDFDDEATTRWHGGAFSRARANRGPAENSADGFGTANAAEEELRQIYQFKHPDIDTEVWFVSLGSELAGNAGMYAFLREHASELKGSVFINLEALGAGDLSYVEKEGKLKKYAASSRMKRYIKKASQASGVSVATTQIGWKESAASVALKHGAQAMSLVGMAGKKPAFYGQGDDVLENLDEEMLQKNADFVMEMLKNI